MRVNCIEFVSYGEEIPRYAANLEKATVSGICNPNERLHVKWRQTLQRKKDRDKKLKARNDRKELMQTIAASVQASDR